MSIDKYMPPQLDTLLNSLKSEIFSTINCIQIGKISKVTSGSQTVEVQIQMRSLSEDGESIAYPVLVDCPYFVLQGGAAYIDMPISIGDYAIVLFNDRDIDNWWSTANVADPNSRRKHSLSDGIAFVGINPKTTVRSLDGTNLRFFGPEIHLNGNSKTFVTHAELNTALQTFVTALNAAFASKENGSGSAGALTIDISAAATTTIKTGG
jgi:hypothetical protein